LRTGLNVTPINVNFGKVLKDASSDRTINVRNTGTAPLTISAVGSPAAPFSIVPGTCTAPQILPSDESCTVVVRFSPTAEGPVSSSFTITSDDPDEKSITIHLRGRGVLHFFVSPDEGTIGSEVTITGFGFGEKKGKLLIGGVASKITEWSDSEIKGTLSKVPTPDVASDVVVQVKKSQVIEPGAFTSHGPEITSVDPGSRASGSTSPVTIYGYHFSTKKGRIALERGGVVKSCKVLIWTMDAASGWSTIQFLVPKKLPAATDYTLKVSNIVGSDTTTFAVTAQ